MKTPEKIKLGLRQCIAPGLDGCHGCSYEDDECCKWRVKSDALALIEHLEAERDALLKEVHGDCDKCKHYDKAAYVEPCKSCRKTSGRDGFEWRRFKPPEVSDGAV